MLTQHRNKKNSKLPNPSFLEQHRSSLKGTKGNQPPMGNSSRKRHLSSDARQQDVQLSQGHGGTGWHQVPSKKARSNTTGGSKEHSTGASSSRDVGTSSTASKPKNSWSNVIARDHVNTARPPMAERPSNIPHNGRLNAKGHSEDQAVADHSRHVQACRRVPQLA